MTQVRRQSFDEYLRQMSELSWRPLPSGLEAPSFMRPPATTRLRLGVAAHVPQLVRNSATRLMAPLSRRRLRGLAAGPGPIRIHMGCGPVPLPGWLNIDVVGSLANVAWDLAQPLPLPAGSASAIFHEHFLEHLPLAAAVANLRECWRLLEAGGILRVGVPDFGRHARSYAEESEYLRHQRPGRPTPLIALSELIYTFEHRSVWDGETLVELLREVGFADVAVRPHGDSRIQPPPDGAGREGETLYVEAVKR